MQAAFAAQPTDASKCRIQLAPNNCCTVCALRRLDRCTQPAAGRRAPVPGPVHRICCSHVGLPAAAGGRGRHAVGTALAPLLAMPGRAGVNAAPHLLQPWYQSPLYCYTVDTLLDGSLLTRCMPQLPSTCSDPFHASSWQPRPSTCTVVADPMNISALPPCWPHYPRCGPHAVLAAVGGLSRMSYHPHASRASSCTFKDTPGRAAVAPPRPPAATAS